MYPFGSSGILDAEQPVPKRLLSGTHRICAPSETLARTEPLLRALGITRVADITGLDTLGIPVCQAIRPNSRALSVSQGKGLSHAGARASAVMESVEMYC